MTENSIPNSDDTGGSAIQSDNYKPFTIKLNLGKTSCASITGINSSTDLNAAADFSDRYNNRQSKLACACIYIHTTSIPLDNSPHTVNAQSMAVVIAFTT